MENQGPSNAARQEEKQRESASVSELPQGPPDLARLLAQMENNIANRMEQTMQQHVDKLCILHHHCFTFFNKIDLRLEHERKEREKIEQHKQVLFQFNLPLNCTRRDY